MTFYTVGGDPEFIVTTSEGDWLPPYGAHMEVINQSLASILPSKSAAFHDDGAAFELSIKPAESIREYLDSVHTAMSVLRRKMGGVNVSVLPYHVIGDKIFDYEKYGTLVFGCKPSINIGAEKERLSKAAMSEIARNTSQRCTGGHLHVNLSNLIRTIRLDEDDYKEFHKTFVNFQKSDDITAVKNHVMWPFFVDISSVLEKLMTIFTDAVVEFYADSEEEKQYIRELEASRRAMGYGLIGDVRPTVYADGTVGVELRSPSSYWLRTSPHNEMLEALDSAFQYIIDFPHSYSSTKYEELLRNKEPIEKRNSFLYEERRGYFQRCIESLEEAVKHSLRNKAACKKKEESKKYGLEAHTYPEDEITTVLEELEDTRQLTIINFGTVGTKKLADEITQLSRSYLWEGAQETHGRKVEVLWTK